MKIICGVDVSRACLDAAVMPGGLFQRFDNTDAGIAALAAFCRLHHCDLAVMEATGGYERAAFCGLWKAGVQSAIVNARKVRDFAKAMDRLEKTDRLDAGVIARYAQSAGVTAMLPPSSDQTRLTCLVRRLSQLTRDISTQTLRLSQAGDAMVIEGIEEVRVLLKRQAARLEGEIASLIDDDPVWSRLGETITSIKGVAGRTLACLMAELPEIGTVSEKAITKLAGLAPLADDSGKRQGSRHIRAGRAPVRHILYIVAEIASRYDDHLKAFHQRLILKNKPKKVIRIALARKLLVILNAKARDARKELENAT